MQRLSIIPLNGLPKCALSTMCLMMRTLYLTQRSSIHTTCTYCYMLRCIQYLSYDIDFVCKTKFQTFQFNICTIPYDLDCFGKYHNLQHRIIAISNRLIVEIYSPNCAETFHGVELYWLCLHLICTVEKRIFKHRKNSVLNEKKIASISIWSLFFYYFLFISQIPSF